MREKKGEYVARGDVSSQEKRTIDNIKHLFKEYGFMTHHSANWTDDEAGVGFGVEDS